MNSNTTPLYALTPIDQTEDLEEGYHHTVGSEYVAYLHKGNVPDPYKTLHGWDTAGLKGYLRPLPEGTVAVPPDVYTTIRQALRCIAELSEEDGTRNVAKEALTKLAQMGERSL